VWACVACGHTILALPCLALPCRGVSHFFGFFLGAAWVLNPLAADFVADGGRAGAAAEPAAWSGAADETAAETVELTGALPWTPV
jgi:hypothetical protein